MIALDELAAWLRLLETPRIGRESARKLLRAFGSPEQVLASSPSSLREVLSQDLVSALGTPPDGFRDHLARTVEWLQAAPADSPRAVIPLGHELYPPALLESPDPPLMFYAQGHLEWLQGLLIGVVGSRHPTPQGLEDARAFAHQLSHAGITIVSGMALGIDAAAHEGALTERGRSIAVVGTGLDRIYPSQHRDLAHRLAHSGLIISEYPLGARPIAAHFPQRNRIIAGLSRGILVVEAALKSGSLITARLALEANRDVYAIPGSIHSLQSKGCHALIKQGAKLVEAAADILEELHLEPRRLDRPSAEVAISPPHPILDAMAYTPIHLDALMARTGHSASSLSSELLQLELEGLVARLPGQLFQRQSLT